MVVERIPIEDDVLPLTKPIVGTSGRVYTELPIQKGTPVTISTVGYNLYVFFGEPRRYGSHIIVSWQEPRFVGSGCQRVPTRALVRNGWASGITRWGVWEPVRTHVEL